MWLEIIVGGRLVVFTQAGMQFDGFGNDPRCEWASRIEAEARRICGRTEGVRIACFKGDLSVNIHEDAVHSVVRAIAEAVPSMPVEVLGFFQRVSYLLEKSESYSLRDLVVLGQTRGARGHESADQEPADSYNL